MLVLTVLSALLLSLATESLETLSFTRVMTVLGWEEARQECLARQADLATIDSYATEYLLQAFARNSTYNNDNIWIGLHDVSRKNGQLGSFQWSTCRALSDTGNWTNWDEGQPQNPRQAWCIRMKHKKQLKWTTELCSALTHSLCQKTRGPCVTFKREAEGCHISSDWLNATALENVTSISSKSACQEHCVNYGAEDGSSPLCWAYEFRAGLTCLLYVHFRPVFCQGQKGTTGPRMVRDCYSISYNTTPLSSPKTPPASMPGINCTGVTTTPATTTSSNQYQNSTTTVSPCTCSCYQLRPLNVSAAKVTEMINLLKKELTVNTSTLSSTRRKKESAPDARPSAQAAGVVGIVILVLVGSLIVIPDLVTFARAVSAWRLKRCQQKDKESEGWEMRDLNPDSQA